MSTEEGIPITSRYDVSRYDIDLTLDSGQNMRVRNLPDGSHEVASGGRLARVWQEPASEPDDSLSGMRQSATLCVASAPEDVAYWRRALAVDDDYEHVAEVLSSLHNETLDEAMAQFGGIRVLHQEPFEAFVTSVITQNNNVPRIRACVEKLCRFSPEGSSSSDESLPPFPDAPELLRRLDAGGKSLGLGYRLPYLRNLCEAWMAGEFAGMVRAAVDRVPFVAGEIESCEEDMRVLLGYRGIGPKVASCCCLFGLGHASAVPVDVWIRRFTKRYDMPWVPEIAGIQQQYVFEWARTTM